MVQEGSFSVRSWLQFMVARLANWLCAPEHLYWMGKDAWDEYLGESTADEMERMETHLAVAVLVPMAEYDWLFDEAYSLDSDIETVASDLLLGRIEQIKAGKLGLGDNVEVVNRWRSISDALNQINLNQQGVLLSMFEVSLPWSDVAVLDGILLEDRGSDV